MLNIVKHIKLCSVCFNQKLALNTDLEKVVNCPQAASSEL